ncbi:condensation domain-containing protein [Streptosporangium canum]|uniref:condensation domain-containing protein n=1 Tax=Streptosporangium canum TaxID=324952 RepID=UPI0033A3CF9C
MSHASFDLRGIPLVLHLNGPLDVPALLGACAAVAARHPVLGRVRVRRVDSSSRRYPEVAAAEVTRPFDLDRGPLARFTLVALGPDRHRLIFTAHGRVFDGGSKDILLRDLADAYFSRAALPVLAPPYGERPQVDGAAAFWKERDRAPAELLLPGLRADPGGTGPGEIVEMVLGGAEFDGVAAAATALEATRFDLLVAVLGVLLRRHGTTGSPLALDLGTRTGETRHHIGNFVAEVPFVPHPELDEDLPAYLRTVQAELRELYRFRHAPPRTTSRPVLLSYRRRASAPGFPGIGAGVEWTVFNGASRRALHVQAVDGDLSLTLGLRFNPTAIDHDDVARVAGYLRALLRVIAAEPHVKIADLPEPPHPEPDEELQ